MAEDYDQRGGADSPICDNTVEPFQPNYVGQPERADRTADACDEACAELLRQYYLSRRTPARRGSRYHTAVETLLDLSATFLGPLSLGAWAALLVVCGLTFVFNLGGARALTEHETYVAAPAKQMLTEGDFLLPRIGDHLWVEKPPLPYWLAAVTCAACGECSEWAVRLPAALAGIGVVLMIAGLNARWFGPTVGLLAGVTQATCVYMVSYARLAEADMLLALVVVAAIGVFDRFRCAVENSRPVSIRRWRAAFWGLIAITGLIKGLLFGAVLIAGPCLMWDLWSRRLAISRQMMSPAGVAFVLLMWAAWPALVVAGEPAALQIWYDHLFGRISGRIDFNVEPVWYYLTSWPWQLLPWTPLLFVAAWPSLKRAWSSSDQPDRFLWCWALVPVLLLSLSRGKHHHYLIYSLPALSSVIALGLMECGTRIREQTHHTLGLARLYRFGVAPATLVAGGIVSEQFPEYRADAIAIATLVATAAILLGYASSRRQTVFSYLVVAVPVVLAIVYVHARVLPVRDPSLADRQFLQAVNHKVPVSVEPVVCGSGDVYGREIARHIFYLDRPVVPVWCPQQLGPIDEPTYIVSRRSAQPELATWGQVTELAASAYSRGEQSPADRFVLLRVEPRR